MKVASFQPSGIPTHSRTQTQHSRRDSNNLHSMREEFLAQFFEPNGKLRSEYQKISYPDGGEYIGQYQDFRSGKGIYSFPNKDSYMGTWKEDKFSGDGLYVYTNGERYQGKFLDGKKHGRGVYYYRSGAVYDGEWHKDRKHGFGIYNYPNG